MAINVKHLNLDGLLYFKNKIMAEIEKVDNKKVDKVVGKGLSTNDLTDELKQKILDAGSSSFNGDYASLTSKPKINNLELNGNVTLEQLGVQAKGDYATKTELGNKANSSHTHAKADITGLPTKLSELTNDSGFQSATQVNAIVDGKGFLKSVPAEYVTETELSGKEYQTSTQVNNAIISKGYQTSAQVSSAINDAIKGITQFDVQVVSQLPSTGVKGTFYLVANQGSGQNVYDEYIWVTNKFESLGKREVDLSGYLKETDYITNAEIDQLFAQAPM